MSPSETEMVAVSIVLLASEKGEPVNCKFDFVSSVNVRLDGMPL